MTRTGTLVVVCWTLAAAFACEVRISAAENLPSLSRSGVPAGDGWASSADEENPFRRSPGTASNWQPQRAVQQVSHEAPVSQPVPATVKKPAQPAQQVITTRPPAARSSANAAGNSWLSPTSQGGRQAGAKPQAVGSRNGDARAPRSFVPPADAQQITKQTRTRPVAQRATAPVSTESLEAAVRPAVARDDAGANLYTGSAASGKSIVQKPDTAKPNSNPVPAANSPRSNPRQTAHRPRPSQSTSRGLLNSEGWIGPLRQVAYQVSGGEEEMPVPPGQRSMMNGPPRGSNRMPQEHFMNEEQPYYDGGMPDGGPMMGDGWIGPSDCDTCGPDGCCGPMCGDSCEPGCGCSGSDGGVCGGELCSIGPHDDESCHTIRVRVPKCQEIMVFGGVHGFKGPFDQDRDSGNFGFQEGLNFGAKLPFTDWGYQVGYQAAQSQLSGDADTNIADPFTQHFFTTGVFHRTRDGLQGGLAWDLLLDPRDTTTDFHQLRGELSFVDCGCHEFGFMGAVHLADEVLFDAEEETTNAWQSTDQYLLFYRMHGSAGGEGRLFAGVTDDSDAVIGADFLLPLKSHWSLQTGFTYLIPEEPAGEIAARQEAWNLGINLVWHWKGRARECHSNPFRPLFNVADNGSMIIDDRP